MQLFLDPLNSHVTSPTKEGKLDWYVPHLSTNPGKPCLPNLSDWEPGDIILFSKHVAGTDLVGTFIEKAQEIAFGQPVDDSQWVHAAVYIGNGACVEAVAQTKSGRSGVLVNLKSLPIRWGSERVRIRRLAKAIWSREVGRDISMYALGHTAHPYPSIWRFASTVAQSMFPRASHSVQQFFRNQNGPEPIHCSLLCRHAIVHATGIDVFGLPGVQTFPYALSQSSYLEDVFVEWRDVK